MRLDTRRRPTQTLRLALLAGLLLGVLPLGAGTAAAASNTYIANCSANLRASASTAGALVASISTGTTVVATGTVSGGAWSATCGGSTVSGSSWYVITTVAGTSTVSRYGKSAVYAATGLFHLAPPPPPPTNYLEGIDVSHWQGTIDWSGVAGAGKAFAIMKASQGQTYADDKYVWNHAHARYYGIRVGAYHFASPAATANDAVLQADWFVQNANMLPGDLNPALDLEAAGGLDVAHLQAWVLAWLNEVYAKTGMRPMIYTSPAFWRKYMGDTATFAAQGYTVLWIAHWFVAAPSIPGSNWSSKGWTFWQYDDCGSVAGIAGCVDLDRFNGLDLTRVTYDPDFNVTWSSTSPTVKQGASTTLTVAIARQYFTLPITISVTGLPDGVTGTLGTDAPTGSTTTFQVTTSNTGTVTPVGHYPITITAVGGDVTRTAVADLNVIDGIAPTVSVPTAYMPSGATSGSTTGPVRVRWMGADLGGIGSYGLQWQVNGGTWTGAPMPSPTATNVGETLTFGAIYHFRVRATDLAGNACAWAYGPNFRLIQAQDSSSAIVYSKGWSLAYTSLASGGSIRSTSTALASATYKYWGAGISWVTFRGPNRGSAQVWIDGVYAGTVNLQASVFHAKSVVFARSWPTNGSHTIRVVNLGTAGHPRIDVDAFIRLVLS